MTECIQGIWEKTSQVKNRFQTLVEMSPEAIFVICNKENNIDYVNKAAIKLFGAESENQIIGHPALDFFPLEYHSYIKERIKTLLSGLPVPVFEGKALRLDGTTVDFESRACLFIEDDKASIQVLLRDIHERKQADAELIMSMEKYRSQSEVLLKNRNLLENILNSIPQSIFWKDLKLVYLGCNKNFANNAGLARCEDVIGKTDYDLPWPDNYTEAYRRDDNEVIMSKQIKAHIIESMEISDGTNYWVDTTKVPLIDSDGNVYAVLGVYEDITESKQSKEMLLRQKAELILANENLNAFGRAVAHDLRNPISAIKGLADTTIRLYSDKMDDRERELLMHISCSALKMNDLIEGLQLLYDISKNSITLEDVDLGAIADSIIAELREAQPHRVVEYVRRGNLTAHADSIFVKIMLTNIIENAWKFTGKTDSPHIEFFEIADEKNSKNNKIYCLKDNGVGFEMAHAEEIFKPFKRLHSGSEFKGTGLGLAIVQRIILRHNGRIWAKGKTGQGAEIYFTLDQT